MTPVQRRIAIKKGLIKESLYESWFREQGKLEMQESARKAREKMAKKRAHDAA